MNFFSIMIHLWGERGTITPIMLSGLQSSESLFHNTRKESKNVVLYEQYFRHDGCERVEFVMKVPLTGRWGRNEPMNCEVGDEELITPNRAAVMLRIEPERRRRLKGKSFFKYSLC
jgi:hypothetical protein